MTDVRGWSEGMMTMNEMTTMQDDAGARQPHLAFRSGYIWVALAIALGAGFPLGAYLAIAMGIGFPLGSGVVGVIQTHGHVQLVGWVGLFIMGISLHVIPRLAGVSIASRHGSGWILWLMAVGLGLRSIGYPVLASLTETIWAKPVVWLVAGSGLLEWGGILMYAGLLGRAICDMTERRERPALRMVQPYMGMMAIGWVLYASLNLGLLVHMALRGTVVVHQPWNQFAIQLFMGLVLLPVAFAFSVRMLPLYLRLPAPTWPVRGMAYAYAASVVVQVLPTAPVLFQLAPQEALALSSLGMVMKGGVILGFVWQLDVLTRHRLPWTVHRKLHPGPERRPTRPGLPDYGEFGRFERLVYAAYVWLVLAAGGEVVSGLATLVGNPLVISPTAIRHIYLLGFITLLIFGMAVRMLPGFWQKRRVASPALVGATFWIGNLAVGCRILLFLLPTVVWHTVPGGLLVARMALALSGVLGWGAVVCLATNMRMTAQKE
jgi:uncharacterized protein involved in response to NO